MKWKQVLTYIDGPERSVPLRRGRVAAWTHDYIFHRIPPFTRLKPIGSTALSKRISFIDVLRGTLKLSGSAPIRVTSAPSQQGDPFPSCRWPSPEPDAAPSDRFNRRTRHFPTGKIGFSPDLTFLGLPPIQNIDFIESWALDADIWASRLRGLIHRVPTRRCWRRLVSNRRESARISTAPIPGTHLHISTSNPRLLLPPLPPPPIAAFIQFD